jgi:predicted nucleic acid-binding protein
MSHLWMMDMKLKTYLSMPFYDDILKKKKLTTLSNARYLASIMEKTLELIFIKRTLQAILKENKTTLIV